MPKKKRIIRSEDELVVKRLTEFRLATGLSRDDVAALLRIVPKTLERWEGGKGDGYKQYLRPLAEIYGRDKSDWYDKKPKPFDRRKLAPLYLIFHPLVEVQSEDIQSITKAIEEFNERYVQHRLRHAGPEEDKPRPLPRHQTS